MQTLFAGLESVFGYFGGVARELMFDLMRSMVIGDN
jgi:hypothetical protein